MIHKHSDCRTLAVPIEELAAFRGAIDRAMSQNEQAREQYRESVAAQVKAEGRRAASSVEFERLKRFTDDMDRLRELRMAFHEDYG